MAAWEYKTERLAVQGSDITEPMNKLNDLGNRGWEAVAWLPNPHRAEEGWILLKKPLRA